MDIKRVIAVFIVGAILFGAEPTYALVDVNDAFSKWYSKIFSEYNKRIEETTANEMTVSFKKLENDIQKKADKAKDQIADFQLKATGESEQAIKAHSDQYMKQINITKDQLQQQLEKQMENYSERTKEKLETQVTQDTESILKELLKDQH